MSSRTKRAAHQQRSRAPITASTRLDERAALRPESPAVPLLAHMGAVLIAAKAAFVPLVIDTLAADSFVVPKVAVSRILSALLATTLIAYFVHHRRPPPGSPVWPPLAAYLVIAAAATIVAVHPYTAVFGAFRRELGLATIVEGALLAVGVATYVRTYWHLRWVLMGVFVGAVGVLAYGVVQLLGRDPLRWVDASLSSTVGNRGVLAGYLVVVCVLAIETVLVLWSRLSRWERLVLAAIASLSAFEVLASGARGPAIALPIAAVAAIFIAFRTASSSRWGRTVLWGALAVAVVAPLMILPFTPAGPRLANLLSGDGSATERALAYRTSFEAIRARPLLGVGPDGLTTVYLALRPAESARSYATAAPTQSSTHSWFLDHAVGTGVLGLTAVLSVVALAILLGLRRSSGAGGESAALGLTALVGFLGQGVFNVSSVATEWLFWLSVGLVVASPLLNDPADPQALPLRVPSRPRRRSLLGDAQVAWVVVAVVVGLGLGSMVISSVSASRAVAVSNAARALGNLALGERAAKEAVRNDPGRADHWNVLGLVYTRREPEKARQAFSRAVAAAPYDPVYLLNLAAEEAVLATVGASRLREPALQHADRAAELDPNGLTTLNRAAEIQLLLGSERAITLIERAILANPNKADGYRAAAELYAAAGDPKRAAEKFVQMLALTQPPGGPALQLRLRAAELLRDAGEVDRIRSLRIFDPPTVTGVDRACSPINSSAEVLGQLLPRCFSVRIASEASIQLDPVRADSAVRVENYMIDGEPLPAGTTVRYEHPGDHVFEFQLPKSALPPRPGAIVSVKNVADQFGQLIDPVASSRSLP